MVAAAGPLNRFGGGRHLWLATVPVAESPLNGGLPVADLSAACFSFAGGQTVRQAEEVERDTCLLYTSPSPRDLSTSRMPSSA